MYTSTPGSGGMSTGWAHPAAAVGPYLYSRMIYEGFIWFSTVIWFSTRFWKYPAWHPHAQGCHRDTIHDTCTLLRHSGMLLAAMVATDRMHNLADRCAGRTSA